MLIVFALAIAACYWGSFVQIKSINTPMQKDQVIVIEKDIYEDTGGEDAGFSLSYFIFFKFPDGSVKEFNVTLKKNMENGSTTTPYMRVKPEYSPAKSKLL